MPGAAFAGLFTPLLSRPLGQGGWGGRRQSTAPPPPDPQALQAQALLALRMSLLARLNDLAGRLVASGHQLNCDIAVDGTRQLAQVACADPADQGAPWSALHGLLAAGTLAPGGADLCFTLTGTLVSTNPCVEAPAPATP